MCLKMTIVTASEVEAPKAVTKTRSVVSQVVACLALNILLVDLGMAVSFVTMVLPEVLGATEGVSIDENQASWFGSMAFICQPLGSIFSGPILDYFGRKKSLFIVNIPHLIAWLLMYFVWDVPSLFVANALLGIGTGFMEAPSITYVGEISDPSVRGILTILTNTFTSTGIFLAYLLGTVLPWRQAALVCCTMPLTSMLLVLFVPETPIWLLSKGRQKDALKSLCQLRGWCKPECVREEFNLLVQYNDRLQHCAPCAKEGNENQYNCEHAKSSLVKRIVSNIKHIILRKDTKRPFVLVMAYFLFYTMSGLLPIRPNMVNVCKALGMKYDAKTIVVLVGAISIAMSLLSAAIVKVIGKRKLVVASMLATSLCSLAISLYANTSLSPNVFSYEPDTFPEPTDILPVILFMALVCFTGLGIPWVLLSEVFPFKSRGIATSFAAAFSYIITFIASKSNYNLEAMLHLSGTFALYASFGMLGTIYLYLFLPETENKTLVEIEKYYKDDVKIFADDFLINAFRKKKEKRRSADEPILVS